jgi:hypothetical protein
MNVPLFLVVHVSKTSASIVFKSASSKEDRDGAKNRTPTFFCGLSGLWRKEGRKCDTTGGNKPTEENKKAKTSG